jgi:hypothetical protein
MEEKTVYKQTNFFQQINFAVIINAINDKVHQSFYLYISMLSKKVKARPQCRESQY